MAEIYRNDATKGISLGITGATNVSAIIKREGKADVNGVVVGDTVQVPYSITAYDGPFVVRWQYTVGSDSYSRDDHHEVVTPYVTIAEMREALELGEEFSDATLVRAERRVRGVIDSHTGQRFGFFEGSRRIIGSGDAQLTLGDRLISVSRVEGPNVLSNYDGMDNGMFYSVVGDGWYLGMRQELPEGDYVFTNVIRDPDSMYTRGGFRDNVTYVIHGTWGYPAVPEDVKEAALIMIEEMLCPQSLYRDRYLKAISGDGWRYEFVSNAYSGTGSVVADQLLEPYRRSSMMVI